MNNDKNDLIWSTEVLVEFGKWLVDKGEYGYGLLCIHGTCLGIKIGSLLKLTWEDFIFYDEKTNPPHIRVRVKDSLIIKDEKKSKAQIIPLSDFIKEYTRNLISKSGFNKEKAFESPLYLNIKTGKVLTTSSLNRELNKFLQEYKLYIYARTYLDLKLRDLKTNTFEIAWGRDMIMKYNNSKKVFIAVSKYMGHRTVNDTIKLLELEPNDDINFSYDMYNTHDERVMSEIFANKHRLIRYLLGQEIAVITKEYLEDEAKLSFNIDTLDDL